ncbi:hypothetical protein K1X84_01655 [bacterium]|nr:hypothetical protein [bacterium]
MNTAIKDTTGAGKTLDKLLNWWDRLSFNRETEAPVTAEVLIMDYEYEWQLLRHLEVSRLQSRYPFIETILEKVIHEQRSQMQQLKDKIAELTGEEPQAASPDVPREIGVPLSLDIQYAHELYDLYRQQIPMFDHVGIQTFLESMAEAKKLQAQTLLELAPKFHN